MRLLPALLLLLCGLKLSAQTTDVTVTVLDEKLRPLAGARVELVETQAMGKATTTTNAQGVATLLLSEGASWMLHINGVPYKQYVAEVVPDGISSSTFKVVHNVALLNRLTQQVYKRQHLQLQPQQVGVWDQPAREHSKIAIQVVNASKQPQRGRQVFLANLKAGLRYSATTNAEGFAYFLVPNKSNYDVDVEEVLNITYIDLDHRDQGTIETTLQYTAPAYKEQDRQDTITQVIQPGVPYFGGRALTTITMLRSDNRNIKNEPVYLKDVQSNKVYQASTNEVGKASFVLPFDSKYLISFRYQPNVDVINLMEVRGRATASFEVTYSPLPELEYPERFLPSPREIKLFDRDLFPLQQQTSLPLGNRPIILAKQLSLPPQLPHNKLAQWRLQLPLDETRERLPCNIVFLLDRSGSMEADSNFYTLKTYLKKALTALPTHDRAAVVFYNDDKKIALPLQTVSGKQVLVQEAIEQIETSGSTNIASALHYAYEVLEKEAQSTRNNIVVIVSDGYDESSAQELDAIGKKYAHKSRCVTLGIGDIYNRDFLQTLADQTGGKHYRVSKGKALDVVFNSLLQELQQPVYENATLVLEPVEGITRVFRDLDKAVPVVDRKLSIGLGNAVAGTTLSATLQFSAPTPIDLSAVPARLLYQMKTATGMRSFDIPLEKQQWQQAYTDAIDAYFVNLLNSQLQAFALSNTQQHFAQSRNLINQVVKTLSIWEGESPSIKTNEHYVELKKTIQQYERAISNRGKGK